jgi:catechol 2,3-dioxygenase-like lactoylglutathione lyase family enzyme
MGELRRVTIRASDAAASREFFETVLQAVPADAAWSQLSVEAAGERTVTRRLHVAFAAPSRAEVDEFWRIGTAAGYRGDGEPGERQRYAPDYYGSFLLDPDGNSVEAVHLSNERSPGLIDHIWLRVSSLEESRPFYVAVGERAGFERGWEHDDPPRTGFRGGSATFSIVEDGGPTRGAAIEFVASEDDSLIDPDGNTILLTRV